MNVGSGMLIGIIAGACGILHIWWGWINSFDLQYEQLQPRNCIKEDYKIKEITLFSYSRISEYFFNYDIDNLMYHVHQIDMMHVWKCVGCSVTLLLDDRIKTAICPQCDKNMSMFR